ncbi:MAG: hypothetical protein PVH29_00570 [Candidatus Zixiibacteriota bacterium]|jgi:hypothetical protein
MLNREAKIQYKKSALDREMSIAHGLIETGFREIQRLDGANDLNFVPLLLISSGYERLLKCILFICQKDDDWAYEGKRYDKMGIAGHDIGMLLNDLLSLDVVDAYSRSCKAAEKDIDDIRNDGYLNKLLGILTNFGLGSRYYNLDVIFKEETEGLDPEEEFERIGTRSGDYGDDVDELIKHINKDMIISFEKFTRALARLLTLGTLGDFAKVLGNELYDFLVIADEEFGEKEY